MVKSNLCKYCGKEVEAKLLELGMCVCRECAKKPFIDFRSEKVQDDNFVTVDGFNDRDSANKEQPTVLLGVLRDEVDVSKHEVLGGAPANPDSRFRWELEDRKRENRKKRKKLLVRIGTITVLVLIAVLIGLGVAYII